MTTIQLPRYFIEDHADRELPCGEMVRTARGYSVTADDETFQEILSDARHYAHPHGPDQLPPGLRSSAKATVAALEKAGIK